MSVTGYSTKPNVMFSTPKPVGPVVSKRNNRGPNITSLFLFGQRGTNSISNHIFHHFVT